MTLWTSYTTIKVKVLCKSVDPVIMHLLGDTEKKLIYRDMFRFVFVSTV